MARGEPGEEGYTPRVSAEDLPRKIIPRPEAPPVGAAFASAFDATDRKYQADSATWAGDQIAQARIKAVNDLETAKANAPAGDQTGFTEKYLDGFDKDTAALADNAGSNPVARQMLTKGITDLRQTLYNHTQGWVAQQNVAYRSDSLQNNLKTQLPILEAHPELRDQVMSTLMDQNNATGAQPADRLKFARYAESAASEAAATGLAKQNPDLTLHDLSDPAHPIFSRLNDEQRGQIKNLAQGVISSQYSDAVVGAYRAGGPQAGGRALGAIDKIDEPPEIKKTIYAHIEQGINQWHEEAKQTHADQIMGFEAKLASGQATPDDIGTAHSLYNSGAWSAQETGMAIGRIQKAALDKIPDDTYKNYVSDAVTRGQPLDPMDKDLRKATDAVFEDQTKDQQPGSPGWINRGADMARRTGIVPDSMVSWSRSQIVSGDDSRAVTAAQTLSRLNDADGRGLPYALKDDKETVSAAKMINDAVTAGADPKAAVANARAIMAMPDGQKLALEQKYRDDQVAKSSAGSLKNLFKADAPYTESKFLGMGTSIPDIPPAMLGQYEQLRQDYYKTTGGNVKQASELAQADLKNVWGVSEVNGKREFMMYAPEAQHVGLTTDTVRDAMQKFVADQAGVKPELVDRDKVHLTPTVDTATTNGQKWAVSIPDKFGFYGPVLDKNNNPLVFTLPTATAQLKSQASQSIFDQMNEERKQQKIDNEGETWLHQGLLQEKMQQDKFRRENPVGEEFVQGRRAGY